ncbi:MAG: glutaredoxin domain-containing protein [Actinomycetes bacterium]|jgi:mycoredoxin
MRPWLCPAVTAHEPSSPGSPGSPGSPAPAAPVPTPDVTVYWRPGCPFCTSLFRQLERAEVEHTRVNIWEDPEAAAVVRSIARGNETVPTVVVGGPGGLGLVNPNVAEILAAAGHR